MFFMFHQFRRGEMFASTQKFTEVQINLLKAKFEAWIVTQPFYGYDHWAEDCIPVEEILAPDSADGGYLEAQVHGAWLAYLECATMMAHSDG
jgi:hypothetical protein